MRRNLFLYLALGCFVAIIGIFAHGYMGIYDTTYVTASGWEQKIEHDFRQREWVYEVRAKWGETVPFRYEIENRRFSSYSTSIRASLWKENEKILDLFAEDKSIKPFDKVMVKWTLDSEQLQAQDFDAGRYTVKIERKGVEREITVHFRDWEGVFYEDVILPPPWR
ncbi:hypothetical protein M1N18_00570 [Dehalococcoidales bacterium]|nr:hypothetical protein [Dehalococcoidales bacterium]MCL0053236.1 hypothetical protein [Dehalococcoidales bacterium]